MTLKSLIEQMVGDYLSEETSIHTHPDVLDLRSKGYSVYPSKIHSMSPHVIHEVEKNGQSLVVVRHEGDGKYRIRTGSFGGMSRTSYDTLHAAVKNGMRVKNTKRYPSISSRN